jgi:hypothetical protein
MAAAMSKTELSLMNFSPPFFIVQFISPRYSDHCP